jgi:hypothetical protein
MTRIVALLDKPSTHSMGAVPIVLRSESDTLIVSGMKGGHRPIAEEDLRELISSNQAMPAAGTVTSSREPNLLAMWIGSDFASRAEMLQVSTSAIGPSDLFAVAAGRFWLGPPEEVYVRLVTWIEKAFRRVVASSNAELARLMIKVMPDHELTRAAVWFTTPKTARAELLQWYVRIDRDANRTANPADLARRYESLCAHPPFSGVKVVLVSGKAGTGHREAAQRLTSQLTDLHRKAAMVSFGQYLRQRWIVQHGREASQRELQQLGQELVTTTPFLFAREVVSQRPSSIEFLVVDGVRHHIIRDALQFMFDADKKLFAVKAPEQQVRQRLLLREGENADVVREIMNDPTELEIPDLIRIANQVIPYDDSFRLDEEKLREASEAAVA